MGTGHDGGMRDYINEILASHLSLIWEHHMTHVMFKCMFNLKFNVFHWFVYYYHMMILSYFIYLQVRSYAPFYLSCQFFINTEVCICFYVLSSYITDTCLVTFNRV